MDDSQSRISSTASSVFEGSDAPHLQFHRKDRKEIRGVIADFFVRYDKYAAQDLQEWEAMDADLDLFDEVLEMDTEVAGLYRIIKIWVGQTSVGPP